MNHYSGFDPYVIKERNEEIRREVRALRLEGRLRQGQRQTPSRLVDFALRSTLPLLRSVGLAERSIPTGRKEASAFEIPTR